MYHNDRQIEHTVLEWLEKDAEDPEEKREGIYYTSNLASNDDCKTARASIITSVRECGLECIDLLLLRSAKAG